MGFAHPEPNIGRAPALSKIFISRPGSTLKKSSGVQAPPQVPPQASDVVMGSMFFSISYQIMLDCWRENPVDRPTFERLRNTMKEMERNRKVRRVRSLKGRNNHGYTEGSIREKN